MHFSGPILAIGLTLGAYSADHGIQREIAGNRGAFKDELARVGEQMGNGLYVLPALAASYAAGRLGDDAELQQVGRYGTESFVLSGLAAHALKQLTGRHRPYTGDGRDAWDGPRFSNSTSRLSFPSGHTTTAFALAATVDSVYDAPWVAPTAYSLAAVTAWSRVYANRHWASDVVAGAALGVFTAKAIVGYHARKDGQSRLLPAIGPRYAGITWQRPF